MSFRVTLLIIVFILLAISLFFAFTAKKSYPQVEGLPNYDNIATMKSSK